MFPRLRGAANAACRRLGLGLHPDGRNQPVTQRVEVDALTAELTVASIAPRPDQPALPESPCAQVRMSGARERARARLRGL